MPFFTTSDGCNLFYELRGNDAAKPFIVFLNGFTQTTVYWYGRVRAFSKRFAILLYDARGQGQSGLGDQQPTLEQHVGDLSELLTHLKIRRPHLVGLSHGARVAMAYAAARPNGVNRLVLCGVGAGDNPATRRIVQSWYAIMKTGDATAVATAILPSIFGRVFLEKHAALMTDIAAAVFERNRLDAMLTQLKALSDYPAPESVQLASGIDCLVVGGTDDPLVSPADAADLAARLKGRHKILADVGHSQPVEAPRRFDRLVLDFLLR